MLRAGLRTITRKVQPLELPQLSVAVAVMVLVVSRLNTVPEGGTEVKVTELQPPVAVRVQLTEAFELQVKSTMSVGQMILNAFVLFTITVNEQLVDWPQLLLAVQVTKVVPIGKVLPLGGVHETFGGGLQPPVAELV
jgi:hypothetical protein